MAADRYETTLLELFRQTVTQRGESPAIWRKERPGGTFAAISWRQLASDARELAAGLLTAGIAPEDRVVQVAENRYEWIVVDLAIQLVGAIHVPVHTPLTGAQILEQILDSEASAAILSGDQQAKKLAPLEQQLPGNLRLLSMDPCRTRLRGEPLRQLASLLPAEERSPEELTPLLAPAAESVTPDSLATILYTSGTTGEPKGVMLTQRNLVSNALASVEGFGQRTTDMRVNFLPLSHIFARTCDLYTTIALGAQLALAESRETVVADCAATGPSIICGVPYFYEKVMQGVIAHGAGDQPGTVRGMLGGNLRACISGGAALPDSIYDFYQRQEMPVLQGYGLTESSPVITLNAPECERRGTVGRAIPDVEIKIAADGEILTRGPHVMRGYWKNQPATEAILRDGWLATGDLGSLDADQFLSITGRKKEIIVTAGGKNIAPVLLESLLTRDPLIIQAVVVGDGRKYLTALIVPDPDELRREINEQRIRVFSRSGALKHPKVLAMYEERIKAQLVDVSPHEQVRKFTLMPRGFTMETGEMTTKLTLRRGAIIANCAAEIEAMYAETSAE